MSTSQQLTEEELNSRWVRYFLGRFATMTIHINDDDATETEPREITLMRGSEKFKIVDRGTTLTTSPTALFDDDRTLTDALETAKAMAIEVYNNGWQDIEIEGYDKMVSRAWVEFQALGNVFGFTPTIGNYAPTEDDVRHLENREDQS
ncbi:MAG: hypothetical protein ACE365_05970 [Gammaproteobacteria bacterium]